MPNFRSEETKFFYDYWCTLRDGRMPGYRDWDPIGVAKQMPWATTIERGGSSGFRFRFAGTAVCAYFNEEITGQEVGSWMDADAKEFYFVKIEEMLLRPCGMLFTSHSRSETGRDCLFETISLPLSDSEGVGARLMLHQIVIEGATYGDASPKFSVPETWEWLELGAGVPAIGMQHSAQSS